MISPPCHIPQLSKSLSSAFYKLSLSAQALYRVAQGRNCSLLYKRRSIDRNYLSDNFLSYVLTLIYNQENSFAFRGPFSVNSYQVPVQLTIKPMLQPIEQLYSTKELMLFLILFQFQRMQIIITLLTTIHTSLILGQSSSEELELGSCSRKKTRKKLSLLQDLSKRV